MSATRIPGYLTGTRVTAIQKGTGVPVAVPITSVAYTLFVWSRLSAPVELSTRYTTPDNGRDRQYECDRGIK